MTGRPVWAEPDLDFIRALQKRGGESYKKCMQCGTCSATCNVTPDSDPFPRKEMAWAVWGMKDRLLTDPDIWLCYHCDDCSTYCPRNAKPGNVLAAVRQECITHYAAPRFLSRWVNDARFIPLLIGFPALLFGLLARYQDRVLNFLGNPDYSGEPIVFSYTSMFPHRVLNALFLTFAILVFIVSLVGVTRFWRALKAHAEEEGRARPVKGIGASIWATLKRIVTHDNFTTCTTARWRFLSHIGVFFGFMALMFVSAWVVTSGINPLVRGDFIYPFNFWSPWKMLANIGGAALALGCILMILDKLRDHLQTGRGSFSDWMLIFTLFFVVVSGFLTEVLHYARMEPHRHIIYFAHLVLAFVLLVYMPYSKFAHILYRTTALVFTEHTGRRGEVQCGDSKTAEGAEPAGETTAHERTM